MFKDLEAEGKKKQKESFRPLIKLVFQIFLCAHIFCYLWALLGIYELHIETDSWISIINFSKSYGSNYTYQKPWFIIYLYSFYYIFVTMVTVGYGDFAPKTELEMILCIFTMLFTCGMFAYALNSINTIIANYNQF